MSTTMLINSDYVSENIYWAGEGALIYETIYFIRLIGRGFSCGLVSRYEVNYWFTKAQWGFVNDTTEQYLQWVDREVSTSQLEQPYNGLRSGKLEELYLWRFLFYDISYIVFNFKGAYF